MRCEIDSICTIQFWESKVIYVDGGGTSGFSIGGILSEVYIRYSEEAGAVGCVAIDVR